MPVRDEDSYQPDPAPLLRREFTLSKPVVRARLHVAGLGYCLHSLNGKRLDDTVPDPPWTAFDRRILFRTHDVTRQLVEGLNCLGLALGNGWFNPLPLRMWGQRNIRDSFACGRPRGIALLVVEHPDGTCTSVTTGNGWATAGGPTLKNSIYLGEERDARCVLTGWNRAGFDAIATVVLPGGRGDGVTESGRPVDQSPGVFKVRTDSGNVVVEIGSGRYAIEISN